MTTSLDDVWEHIQTFISKTLIKHYKSGSSKESRTNICWVNRPSQSTSNLNRDVPGHSRPESLPNPAALGGFSTHISDPITNPNRWNIWFGHPGTQLSLPDYPDSRLQPSLLDPLATCATRDDIRLAFHLVGSFNVFLHYYIKWSLLI